MRSHSFQSALCTVVVVCVSGCANLVENDGPAPDATGRIDDFPVQIVAAGHVPRADTDAPDARLDRALSGYLPVTVETRASGRADAAMQGAGMGALECGIRSVATGSAFPLVFGACALLLVPTYAVVEAIAASPSADVDAVRQLATENPRSAAHAVLVEQARGYLAGVSGKPVWVGQGPAAAAGEVVGDKPDYRPQTGVVGTILELGLLEIRLAGSGKADEPLCLHMAARGRKLEAATGRVIHEFGHARMVECHPASGWLIEGGVLLRAALGRGQQILAERLVDQLYLVYRPAVHDPDQANKIRTVPTYVLAPRDPPAPENYLDLRSVTGKARHVQGWGGMHFADVDNLAPTLSWEGFPRAFDRGIGDLSDISYDLRLYSAEIVPLGVAEPAALLHQASGLVEPRYSLPTPLQPCSRYFWTVRARFTLNGMRRVTEWAGAYDTAGGEVSPSYRYFFPFRTASAGGGPDCWD